MKSSSAPRLWAEWKQADAMARTASHDLDAKSAQYLRGQGPAPTREEHEHVFALCVAASRAALTLAADSAQKCEESRRPADSGFLELA
jgi:hypothetical protein